jgi:hypothetical protein
MDRNQGESQRMAAPTQFSADGFWWWDGAEWRPAISPDRLWRWNGSGWVPAQARARRSNGLAIGLIVAVFAVVLVLAAVVTVVVVLLLAGNLGGASSALIGT